LCGHVAEGETAHGPEVLLQSLDDASEEPQDGVQPMIKGALTKTEVCSVGDLRQYGVTGADALIVD
jgi:hypothetical protein